MRHRRFNCVRGYGTGSVATDPDEKRRRTLVVLSALVGCWWVAAVAIAITVGCTDDDTNTADEGVEGTGGTIAVTGGTQSTAVLETTGGNQTTGGTDDTTVTPQVTGGTSDTTVATGGTGPAKPMDGGPSTGDGSVSEGTGGTDEQPGTDAAQEPDPDQSTGKIPPVDNVDGNGPFTPAINQSAGPSGGSWVFYPEELGRDGYLHPVFNWGPGAGTGPREYTDHLSRIASHGIVVISQPSSGTGVTELAALDWILAQNDDPGSVFYQKLDPSKVGAGGHSKGSFTTYAMGDDPRLVTTIQVCGGRSGAGGNISVPVLILGATGDMATPGFTGDYAAINAPVVFLTYQGSDHIMCARDNLVPWVSWLRWHLGGEEFRRDEFIDAATSPYCKAPWDCQIKNW